jgi:DNA polymerase (family 10)
MENGPLARMFNEIADILELEGSDRKFEVRAYRKAALSIESMQEDVSSLYKERGIEGLLGIPGVGKGLALKIEEYIKTGRMRKYEELKRQYPVDFDSLTRIQGIGAKKAYRLYRELGIKDIESLKKALKEHRIMKLEGFGEKSENEIEYGLGLLEASKGRILLGVALPEAEKLRNAILKSGYASKAVIAGSIRRMRETIGDIDILVSGKGSDKIMDFVSKMDVVESTISRGKAKATFWLKAGVSCDIRFIEEHQFGAALLYFTGSKSHNVKMRQIALRKGLKLNEYGIFGKDGSVKVAETEDKMYRALGMDYIAPELREDRGELEAAARHALPELINVEDILGDLHVHSNHSDGMNSIEEMVRAAEERGLKYVGITDHSKSEYVAHGMDDAKFMKHIDYIEALSKRFEGVRVLVGAEVDILKDGSLDLGDKVMDRLDYAIGSVHTSLGMDSKSMTKRISKALESGRVDILGHPTERIINGREGITFDFDEIAAKAAENRVAMEIDSFPERLDLNDENILRARSSGVKFAIDTDSHSISHFSMIRYGVGMARRGWLQKDDVINTYDLSRLLDFFNS